MLLSCIAHVDKNNMLATLTLYINCSFDCEIGARFFFPIKSCCWLLVVCSVLFRFHQFNLFVCSRMQWWDGKTESRTRTHKISFMVNENNWPNARNFIGMIERNKCVHDRAGSYVTSVRIACQYTVEKIVENKRYAFGITHP